MNRRTRFWRWIPAALGLAALIVLVTSARPAHRPSAAAPATATATVAPAIAPAVAPVASAAPATPTPRPAVTATPAPRIAATGAPAPRGGAPAAMRAVIDPPTGELRAPLPDETARIAPGSAVDTRPSQMPEQVLPDGTILVPLDERFMEFMVARRAADGSVRYECAPEGEVEGLRHAPAAPASRWEER